MPADTTLPQAPSAHHGNGDAPYPCSTWPEPPGADWAINHGGCRHSLGWYGEGNPQGHGDPRCPSTCQHKASQDIAIGYAREYSEHGAVAAAAWARKQRSKHA